MARRQLPEPKNSFEMLTPKELESITKWDREWLGHYDSHGNLFATSNWPGIETARNPWPEKFASDPTRAPRRTPPAPACRPGYVYLLHWQHNIYKIGRTRHLPTRLKYFDVHLPFPVSLAYYAATDDMVALETQLHREYAAKRLNGEWFELSDDDVAGVMFDLGECPGEIK